MAIFQSFLLGNVKKSVANLTMYIAKGVSIVRGKPMSVYNPKTDKQLTQRARMRTLSRLSSAFGPALAVGYPRNNGLVSPANRFVKDNLQAVKVDGNFETTIDFTALSVCAAGQLKAPKVVVTHDADANQLVFTQTAQGKTLNRNPRDIVWAVVYEKVQDETEIYELHPRGEDSVTKVDLPEDWVAGNCEFYTFARNEEGTQCSSTGYLIPGS